MYVTNKLEPTNNFKNYIMKKKLMLKNLLFYSSSQIAESWKEISTCTRNAIRRWINGDKHVSAF